MLSRYDLNKNVCQDKEIYLVHFPVPRAKLELRGKIALSLLDDLRIDDLSNCVCVSGSCSTFYATFDVFYSDRVGQNCGRIS